MDGERRGVAGIGDRGRQIEVEFADAIGSIGAGTSGTTAPSAIFAPSQLVGLGAPPTKWSPSSGVKTNRVLLCIDSIGLEVGKERAEGRVEIGELFHVGSLAGAEGMFGAEG